jgi:DNA-binding NarL/FixJ family response regulator
VLVKEYTIAMQRTQMQTIIIGTPLYSRGIANILLQSGGPTTIVDLDEAAKHTGLNTANLIIVCAETATVSSDALVKRIGRRNRGAFVIVVSNCGWEERLDHISDHKVRASLDLSISGEQLLAVIDLVMDGFHIV